MGTKTIFAILHQMVGNGDDMWFLIFHIPTAQYVLPAYSSDV